MPIYYCHPKTEPPEHGEPYNTRLEAIAAQRAATDYIITVVATDAERENWHQRERARFASEYVNVPWHNTYEATYGPLAVHFAHLSKTQPGLIAYTKNDEHGLADRQTVVKPMKYLQAFFPNTATGQRTAWANRCTAQYLILQVARTAEDIERVYRNGPESCMSHSPDEYSCDGRHPVIVYGDSDLAVAYTGHLDAVSSRAVIYPAKKLHTRIYGDTGLIGQLLNTHGYSLGPLTGAKIHAIENDDGSWMMPYIDHHLSARGAPKAARVTLTADGLYFTIDESNGDHPADNTEGHILNTRGRHEPTHERSRCVHCNDWYTSNDDDNCYCDDCDAAQFYCDGCQEDCFDSDGPVRVGLSHYCENCANERTTCCALCDTTFYAETFSLHTQQQRRVNRVEDLCADCESNHRHCAECDAYTVDETDDDSAPCEHCSYQPDRVTPDLLATVDDCPRDLVLQSISDLFTPDRGTGTWYRHSRHAEIVYYVTTGRTQWYLCDGPNLVLQSILSPHLTHVQMLGCGYTVITDPRTTRGTVRALETSRELESPF